MDSTLALGALRIARGAGGEGVDVNGNLVEREKGDVWNRNSCVLIDYGLWAAKSEGRPWVDQCLDHHLNLHLNLAGLRRPRLYGFHTGTRSLSNRKGRGRRRKSRRKYHNFFKHLLHQGGPLLGLLTLQFSTDG